MFALLFQSIQGGGDLAQAFEPARNSPDAWGKYNLSAGWVSDVDFFKDSFGSGGVASAASSLDTALSALVQASATRKGTIGSEENHKLRRKPEGIPRFVSGQQRIDSAETSLFRNAVLLVQEEGYMI